MVTLMQEYKGKAVNKHVAAAKIKIYKGNDFVPQRRLIRDVQSELEQFYCARNKAVNQLKEICQRAVDSKNQELSDMLMVQQMIIEDEKFDHEVKCKIEGDRLCAAYAIYEAGRTISNIFIQMEDEYMQARAIDVLDAVRRIIRILSDREEENIASSHVEKVILVANNLGPSDVIKFGQENVCGFVTKEGSVRSHISILANSYNIPAIIIGDLDISILKEGQEAILDGENGIFIVEPDARQMQLAKEKIQNIKLDYKAYVYELAENKRIRVCSNVSSLAEVDMAYEKGSDGIGLFRSEFLFIGRAMPPDEEEQYEIYKAAALRFKDKPVVIRTLDIGADKMPDFWDLSKEENPALGLRGIRFCLKHREIFKTQLRALFRAAVFGNLSIMYPMIISEKEIDDIYDVVKEVELELIDKNIEYIIPKQGIMIETPAAVFISQQLAKRVDFFSIGTNDLTQYALALDRQNGELEEFCNPHHPAILSMIKMVIENAHKAGIRAGICGDLARDLDMTEGFIEMGIDELSV